MTKPDPTQKLDLTQMPANMPGPIEPADPRQAALPQNPSAPQPPRRRHRTTIPRHRYPVRMNGGEKLTLIKGSTALQMKPTHAMRHILTFSSDVIWASAKFLECSQVRGARVFVVVFSLDDQEEKRLQELCRSFRWTPATVFRRGLYLMSTAI